MFDVGAVATKVPGGENSRCVRAPDKEMTLSSQHIAVYARAQSE